MIPLKDLKIGIIGTGNVAWHLCRLFKSAELKVSGALVRNAHRAREKKLAELFQVPLVDDMDVLKASSDIVFIAVSDSGIAGVAQNFKDFKGIVVHTAGSVPLDEISAYCNDSAVFYPLQTLTIGTPVEAGEIPFCIEAARPETERLLLDIALAAGSPAVRLDSGQRLLLHVAAVIACNFSNHLNVLAREVVKAGHADFTLLLPLIRETNRKLQGADPHEAQTGPAVRGDIQTIEKHIRALSPLKDIRQVYQVLSDSIIHHHQKKQT